MLIVKNKNYTFLVDLFNVAALTSSNTGLSFVLGMKECALLTLSPSLSMGATWYSLASNNSFLSSENFIFSWANFSCLSRSCRSFSNWASLSSASREDRGGIDYTGCIEKVGYPITGAFSATKFFNDLTLLTYMQSPL